MRPAQRDPEQRSTSKPAKLIAYGEAAHKVSAANAEPLNHGARRSTDTLPARTSSAAWRLGRERGSVSLTR
jgi:hypothetical protein